MGLYAGGENRNPADQELDLRAALDVAKEAATAVGDLLLGGIDSNADKHARSKILPNDVVTAFDLRAEETIVEKIAASYPDHGVLSEEGTDMPGNSVYRWIIDPLDGTSNFLSGFPHFSVSLALLHRDLTLVGCIFDPSRNEMFTAVLGQGAFLNDRKIEVSPRTCVRGGLVAVGLSSLPERAVAASERIKWLIPHARSLRVSGSACLDLAYVSSGRLDGVFYLALSLWDVAAGGLLVREAGGSFTDLEGEAPVDPERGVLATNGEIHAEMVSILEHGRLP